MPLFQIPALLTAEGATEADARRDAEATVAAMTSVQDVATITLAGPFFLVFQDLATEIVGPFATADDAQDHADAITALGASAESFVVTSITSPTDDLAAIRRILES